MLVAVSVLTVMILSVGQILVQSQRFISVAQRSRRTQAKAFAIAQIIRRDFRRMSKEGFMEMTANGDLVFSTAYPASGINSPVQGDGSIVVYGRRRHEKGDGSSNSGTHYYVWRKELICSFDPQVAEGGIHPDYPEQLNVDFTKIQQYGSDPNSNRIGDFVSVATNGSLAPPQGLKLPPESADDFKHLWQVLVGDLKSLDISYPREVGGVIQRDGRGNIDWVSSPARWSHKGQGAWPKAVKFTMVFGDEGAGDGITLPKQLRKYEVICALAE